MAFIIHLPIHRGRQHHAFPTTRRHSFRYGVRRTYATACSKEEISPERDFRPHGNLGDDIEETPSDIPLELSEGYLENTDIRPKIDIDADEDMLMWRLRRMLHKDDFKRIFDSRNSRIGEL